VYACHLSYLGKHKWDHSTGQLDRKQDLILKITNTKRWRGWIQVWYIWYIAKTFVNATIKKKRLGIGYT
jgi:hypothetical protein